MSDSENNKIIYNALKAFVGEESELVSPFRSFLETREFRPYPYEVRIKNKCLSTLHILYARDLLAIEQVVADLEKRYGEEIDCTRAVGYMYHLHHILFGIEKCIEVEKSVKIEHKADFVYDAVKHLTETLDYTFRHAGDAKLSFTEKIKAFIYPKKHSRISEKENMDVYRKQ